MLHVQHPPSMSSAFISNLNGPLSHLRDRWGATRIDHLARGGQCLHTPPLLGSGLHKREHFTHGLETPPQDRRDMNNTLNPLLNPNVGGQQYQRVPVVSSNAPPYPNTQAAIDNTKASSGRQPFYNSYYSAKRPQSPVQPQKDHVAQSEQTARRRASSDGNSIASHLQIPASINDSKGSLPEFAAQVHSLSFCPVGQN